MKNVTNKPATSIVDEKMDVRQRLDQLAAWNAEYKREDAKLLQLAKQLDDTKASDCQKGVQISVLRREVRMHLVKEPLEISLEALLRVGGDALRDNIVQQIAALSKEDRVLTNGASAFRGQIWQSKDE